jgi:hypothetical protein
MYMCIRRDDVLQTVDTRLLSVRLVDTRAEGQGDVHVVAAMAVLEK